MCIREMESGCRNHVVSPIFGRTAPKMGKIT